MTTLNSNNVQPAQQAPKPNFTVKPVPAEDPSKTYALRSYRLTKLAVRMIEDLAERLSSEAGFKISMSKTIELAVASIQFKKLSEILKG